MSVDTYYNWISLFLLVLGAYAIVYPFVSGKPKDSFARVGLVLAGNVWLMTSLLITLMLEVS